MSDDKVLAMEGARARLRGKASSAEQAGHAVGKQGVVEAAAKTVAMKGEPEPVPPAPESRAPWQSGADVVKAWLGKWEKKLILRILTWLTFIDAWKQLRAENAQQRAVIDGLRRDLNAVVERFADLAAQHKKLVDVQAGHTRRFRVYEANIPMIGRVAKRMVERDREIERGRRQCATCLHSYREHGLKGAACRVTIKPTEGEAATCVCTAFVEQMVDKPPTSEQIEQAAAVADAVVPAAEGEGWTCRECGGMSSTFAKECQRCGVVRPERVVLADDEEPPIVEPGRAD